MLDEGVGGLAGGGSGGGLWTGPGLEKSPPLGPLAGSESEGAWAGGAVLSAVCGSREPVEVCLWDQ